jgi:hypothetical protein
MMATTHAFAGVALAAALAVAVPTLAPALLLAAAVGALAGGVFPDLDLVATHRRTLHFPVAYWLVALPAAAVALAVPTPATVGVAFFLLSTAVHSSSDVIGGGLETRPWLGTSDKAVYLHVRGRWLAPRQWIRYDGAPEDFAVGALFAAPALLVFGGRLRLVLAAMLGASFVYTVVRKKLVEVAPERFL